MIDPLGLELKTAGSLKFAKKVQSQLQNLVGNKALVKIRENVIPEMIFETHASPSYVDSYSFELANIDTSGELGSNTALGLIKYLVENKRVVELEEASDLANASTRPDG